MTDKLNNPINEALSQEDEELLNRFAGEPGYFPQAFALFRGRLGWVMWLVGIVQLLLFVGAVYTFVRMLGADDLMMALRWGIGTVVLVQMSTLLRSFMGMHFEANRLLREIKRIELRLVRLEGDGA